ncbi:MAG: DUF4162 domain-containing protein, partial [Candidatus Micrarchaeota archaeon]|nr:DUF4162 domain-containing protein [Candidatus Micrarchaeota archaeon]
VLFLDEPTLGLDPQTRENLWGYIKKLSREKKVTIIITTHYMEEADMLCDRLAIIDHGKIVALDTPANLKKLLGGDVVKLKIKKPKLAAVRKLKFVKKVRQDGEIVTLTVQDAGKHLQEILRHIGNVESVESRVPTLNDVFIYFTGSEIREQEGEGGFFERMIRRGNK